jgi:V8-like Glu-specific endopeptidase
MDAEVAEYALAPDEFFATSEKDDWTAVRVKGDPASRWGVLSFVSTKVAADDRVNIIQHAGGGSKQLSFYANVVVFVGEGRVQYLTDTLPGSSGSPVFDRDWRLVAVHHSGGWLVEPGSKDDVYYRNEGILIDVVIAGLKTAGAPE